MLAEKYRPQSFDQIIGQDKVITALKYYLAQPTNSGKAFLLTGPSGSGKTTLAQCAAHHWNIPPHGIHKIESATCDVSRLDQVSHNMYVYGPGEHGRKMYIIDEIHTVSERGMDRLLSLLEELPDHVLLFGTTTESDWSGPTLFSRFTRLQLQKVNSADVARHIERIAAAEQLPIPNEPKWAEKMVKYAGLNIRNLLNQLPAELLGVAA